MYKRVACYLSIKITSTFYQPRSTNDPANEVGTRMKNLWNR